MALPITKGFRDALRTAYQNRPRLFVHQIELPQMLYERVIEVDERMSAQGGVLRPLSIETARRWRGRSALRRFPRAQR